MENVARFAEAGGGGGGGAGRAGWRVWGDVWSRGNFGIVSEQLQTFRSKERTRRVKNAREFVVKE